MSMFIGMDTSNKKILHITDGTHDLTTMKSGVMSSTVFHNDMQFSSYKIVSVTSFEYAYSSGGSAPSPVQYLDGSYRTANYFLIAHCDTSMINLHNIGSDSSFHLLSSSNTKINTPYNFGFTNPNARGTWNGYPTYPTANTYITSTYTLPCICVYKSSTSSAPIIPNLGLASILIIYKPTNQSIGSGVKISSSTIQVGNKDLRNFQYVYSGTVNNHPQCPQITPYIQLVDSSKITGNLEIVSNSGFTSISIGGYNIIATDDRYYDTSGGTTVSVSTSASYPGSRYYNIAPLSGSLLYVIVYQAGVEKFKGYISNYVNYSSLIYSGPSPYNKEVILKTNGSQLLFQCYLRSPYSTTVYTDFVVYYKYF